MLAESQELEVEDNFEGVAKAASDLDHALTNAQRQLATLISNAERQSQAEQANIFKAHLELLRDPSWLGDVTRCIVNGHGAVWAWKNCLTDRIEAQRKLQDATLAARSADLEDVGLRVLRHLLGKGNEGGNFAQGLPDDAILLADDLAPSVTAQIDTSRVKGFCTAKGGPTAHTAILARALGMPAVVAAGPGVLAPALSQSGTKAILDGYRGKLYVAPTEATLAEAQQRIARLGQLQAEETKTRMQPATTTDGHRVEIGANANRADQARRALESGTDFILSAEIIAITLGIVAHEPLPTQITVMAIIALTMTVGVYGIVAAIVKLDDLGLYLSQLQGNGMRPLLRAIGRGILRAAPWLMKGLSIAGTIAMFLVGGGIVTHGIPAVHHALEHGLTQVTLPGWLSSLALPVAQGVVGLLAGLVLAILFLGIQKIRGTAQA